MFGSPTPTKTVRAPASARAAATTIISEGVYVSSDMRPSCLLVAAIVYRRGRGRRWPQFGECLVTQLPHILFAILHPMHPLVEPRLGALLIPRDGLPRQIEVVVAIVIALRVGWVRPIGLMHDSIHDEAGDE